LYLVASSAELAAVVSTALNPLSPCPGMACPLRGSWFLFSFSSFLKIFLKDLIKYVNTLFRNKHGF